MTECPACGTKLHETEIFHQFRGKTLYVVTDCDACGETKRFKS